MLFQPTERRNWKLGKVTDILGLSTYQVSGPDGGVYRRNGVHMRQTKVTSKACDVSPGILSRITDVRPLTLPEETPPAYNPPTDPPVENNQPRSIREKIAPTCCTNSAEQSLSANRPRREIKPPIHFKDYVTK